MDTTYEIRNNYLFVKVTGNIDINRIKEIVCETSEKLHSHNLRKLFFDVTEVTGVGGKIKSVLEIYDFSSFVEKSYPTGTNWLVLKKASHISEDNFFETVMFNKGFRVKVTTNLGEGLEWLDVSSEEKP